MKCKCGCGKEFSPSRATLYRLKQGKDVGYLPGHAHKGPRNPRWNGGKCKDSKGYILILMPDHPNSRKTGYVAQHHLVMSKHIGRPIAKDEQVHHINGVPSDNKLENLMLMKTTKHKSLHQKGKIRVPKIPKRCPTCDKMFIASYGNHRRNKYCSRECINLSGANHPLARLTLEQVKKIRKLKGSIGQRKIAQRFNISKSQVARIHHNKSWVS